MKILFVATVRSHIGQFHMPFIEALKNRGCQVDAAFKDNSDEKPGLDLSAIDRIYEVPFSRSPYSTDNIKAYKVLKKIIDENDYDAVHCHTPMGAVVARLASADARKKGTKVIYTAHGFHFYKGASKKNWLLFYPVEKVLSKYTDCLITINQEDYDNAVHKGFKAEKIVKVNGVGVDIHKFHPLSVSEKNTLRTEYGYKKDDFILIYPANLTAGKNHIMLFKAVKEISEKYKNIKLLCPGQEELLGEYTQFVSNLGISDKVDFLGYRRDIENLVGLSDVSVSASNREGLPVNLIEAMAIGNAIVATDVRGNRDLVRNGKNGFLVPVGDDRSMADKIMTLMENPKWISDFKTENLNAVREYSTEYVIKQMVDIYKDLNLL